MAQQPYLHRKFSHGQHAIDYVDVLLPPFPNTGVDEIIEKGISILRKLACYLQGPEISAPSARDCVQSNQQGAHQRTAEEEGQGALCHSHQGAFPCAPVLCHMVL